MITRLRFLATLLLLTSACGGGDDDPTGPGPMPEGTVTEVTGGEFVAPENAFWDSARNVWYIADFGEAMGAPPQPGFLARLAADGTVMESRWVDNVGDSPKGMAIIGDNLYVADNTQILEIDLNAEAITDTIPVVGAAFLNGMDTDGQALFIADSGTDALYRFEPGDIEANLIFQDAGLGAPNGVIVRSDNEIIVASLGSFPPTAALPGALLSVQMPGVVTSIGGVSGALDGLLEDGNGGYFVSDFNGIIYQVDSDGTDTVVRNLAATDSLSSVADIGYDPASRRFMVPDLFGGAVYQFIAP